MVGLPSCGSRLNDREVGAERLAVIVQGDFKFGRDGEFVGSCVPFR